MIKILVLCTGNSCRSQMAEGYLNQFLKGKALIFSAGVKNHEINKYAVKIMKDDEVDISNHSSNNISEFKGINFDYLITVCDHANETCPLFISEGATKIHKNFFDPSSITNPKKIKKAFELCRDDIKSFCYDFSKTLIRKD